MNSSRMSTIKQGKPSTRAMNKSDARQVRDFRDKTIIRRTSPERQKRSQKLAPVLVLISGTSLVFWENYYQ